MSYGARLFARHVVCLGQFGELHLYMSCCAMAMFAGVASATRSGPQVLSGTVTCRNESISPFFMLPDCTFDALTTETKNGSLVRAILNSHQLLAFVVLTRTGSFTLAGKQLFLTQSAVSHAIKALEDELGCALFQRTGRGVTMTDAGRQFLPHAEKIISEMKVARSIIEVEIGRMRAACFHLTRCAGSRPAIC
jgi:hypothetical protein